MAFKTSFRKVAQYVCPCTNTKCPPEPQTASAFSSTLPGTHRLSKHLAKQIYEHRQENISELVARRNVQSVVGGWQVLYLQEVLEAPLPVLVVDGDGLAGHCLLGVVI